MDKVGKIISYLLMAGAVIFFVLAMIQGDDTIESNASVQASIIDPFMYLAYIATGLAALMTVGFAIYYLITHPQKAKTSLMGIGALVVVIGISYLMASNEVTEPMTRLEGGVTETTSKRVGMGLIAFYLLAGITILAVILSSFKSIVRR